MGGADLPAQNLESAHSPLYVPQGGHTNSYTTARDLNSTLAGHVDEDSASWCEPLADTARFGVLAESGAAARDEPPSRHPEARGSDQSHGPDCPATLSWPDSKPDSEGRARRMHRTTTDLLHLLCGFCREPIGQTRAYHRAIQGDKRTRF